MQTTTYKDIIDEKIASWQSSLAQVTEQLENAAPDTKVKFSTKRELLKEAITAAITKLQSLDSKETVANTLETKDKILEIFNSIDNEIKEFEAKTPFML